MRGVVGGAVADSRRWTLPADPTDPAVASVPALSAPPLRGDEGDATDVTDVRDVRDAWDVREVCLPGGEAASKDRAGHSALLAKVESIRVVSNIVPSTLAPSPLVQSILAGSSRSIRRAVSCPFEVVLLITAAENLAMRDVATCRLVESS